MLKKSITYTDYNDVEKTEDFYFHLSKTELIMMDVSEEGGLGDYLKKVTSTGDGKQILDAFNMIVSKAYGIRSEDGSKFRKSAEISEEFMASPAFDALFFELMTVPTVAIEFVNGIVPSDLGDLAVLAEKQKELPWANREPTEKELITMTKDQLIEVWSRKGTSQS